MDNEIVPEEVLSVIRHMMDEERLDDASAEVAALVESEPVFGDELD